MSQVSRIGSLAGLACLAWLSAASAARAQGMGEAVRITTVDGVELHGTFYASAAKNAPTVMVLHGIGEDSRKKGYTGLAQALQKDYSVMMFDFRGHGNSKSIQADQFWKFPANLQYVKGGPKSESIDYKDFSKAYYPFLINDIAAVKGFLDRKNDTGACNTSSFIVIGAETGATLGAIWLNSEWHRYKLLPPMMMFGNPQPATQSEGKDTIAAIWLSIQPKLGDRQLSLTAILDVPSRQGGTATLFMYGEEDTAGKTVAKALEKAIKSGKDSKTKFTGAVPVKGNTKLVGSALLLKALGTEEAIKAYLDQVKEDRGNEWTEREYRKTSYVWRIPGLPVISPNAFIKAKPINESNLNFNDYSKYMGSR